MNFSEYQKAAYSTCTPECFSQDYLFLGLMSEIGELAGKMAKQVRGDMISNEAVIGELGDIAWFIAVRALFHGEKITLPNTRSLPYLPIENLLKSFLDGAPSCSLWACFVALCEDFGYGVDVVLKTNIEKLASRQKRGVIQGEGDNR